MSLLSVISLLIKPLFILEIKLAIFPPLASHLNSIVGLTSFNLPVLTISIDGTPLSILSIINVFLIISSPLSIIHASIVPLLVIFTFETAEPNSSSIFGSPL